MDCKLILDSQEIPIKSLDDLTAQFERIRNSLIEDNPIVLLIHSNGNELTIGISEAGGFVQHTDESRNPPYFVSVNRSVLGDSDTVVFFIDGHATEISRRNIISLDKALRVAEHFCQDGLRPTELIDWEAV